MKNKCFKCNNSLLLETIFRIVNKCYFRKFWYLFSLLFTCYVLVFLLNVRLTNLVSFIIVGTSKYSFIKMDISHVGKYNWSNIGKTWSNMFNCRIEECGTEGKFLGCNVENCRVPTSKCQNLNNLGFVYVLPFYCIQHVLLHMLNAILEFSNFHNTKRTFLTKSRHDFLYTVNKLSKFYLSLTFLKKSNVPSSNEKKKESKSYELDDHIQFDENSFYMQIVTLDRISHV